MGRQPNRRQVLAAAATLALCPAPGRASDARGRDIVAWGDSLTAGGYPELAAKLFDPKRVVLNRGIGGQGSASIAIRQGGLPLEVTFAGDVIPAWEGEADACPASCAQAEIVDKNNNILFVSGKYAGSAVGSVAGVEGRITTDPDGRWTFDRARPGRAVSVAPHAVFHLDEPPRLREDIQWIWAGRNDIGRTSAVAEILGNIEAMAGYAGHDRVLVCSVPNGAGEGRDTPVHSRIQALSAALAGRFGRRFVDVRSELIARGDPVADAADIAADIVPASLRADGVHLNRAGAEIVARMMYGRTVEMGW